MRRTIIAVYFAIGVVIFAELLLAGVVWWKALFAGSLWIFSLTQIVVEYVLKAEGIL